MINKSCIFLDSPCEEEMTELLANFGVTSSDPSLPLDDLPIDGSPVTFSGASLTLTIPVFNEDVESGTLTKITIEETGVPNIESVTVIYTPKDDPSNNVTVVTDAAPGTIDIPTNPKVTKIYVIIETIEPNEDTNFEVGAEICFHNLGELQFFQHIYKFITLLGYASCKIPE